MQATGCFGLLSPFLDLTDRGVSSNPTACASSDVVFGSDAKPQYFRESRDAKNDSISVRDAKYNAAGAMHRVAWAGFAEGRK